MAWWENVVQNHPFALLFAQERLDSMPRSMQDRIKKLINDGVIIGDIVGPVIDEKEWDALK